MAQRVARIPAQLIKTIHQARAKYCAETRYAETMELIFEVRDAEEGGYYAKALGHGIFTQADTWDELRENAVEATSLHFEDSEQRPRLIQLHYVKDELIPLEAA